MKNRELNFDIHPTPAELYALERNARAARSEALARLLRRAVAGVKKGLQHA